MTETPRNPFLPPPTIATPAEVVEPDVVLGDAIEVTGPSSPIHAPRADPVVPEVAALPDSAVTASLAVVGLHGGAGTTSLATLLGEGIHDAGTRLPARNPYVPGRPRVVLVARTHARGLAAAEEATTAWSHRELPDVEIVGLVLIDDGPKLGAATQRTVARLLRMAPHGWHIPWVEAWRTTLTPSPTGVRLPRTLKSIRRALGASGSPKGTSS